MLTFIISPAKTMREAEELMPLTQPQAAEKTRGLEEALGALTYGELQALWKTSDALTARSYEELQELLAGRVRASQALLSYDGIQYRSMAPQVMSEAALAYVATHLRIVSGFYGAVRPSDAVVPYRLEMQAKLAVAGAKNLYEFWGDTLAAMLEQEAAACEQHEPLTLVNLASQEYAKAVVPHVSATTQVITCDFGEVQDGKLKMRATQAKAARGAFVAWCAQEEITSPEDLTRFNAAGYQFAPALSTASHLCFALQR